MSGLVQKINENLRSYPFVRVALKQVYRMGGSLLSDRKNHGKGIRCLTEPEKEHLFGYYDKSPYSKDDTSLLYLETEGCHKHVCPAMEAKICCKDLNSGAVEVIGSTKTYNIQQGCMLQWLGPDYSSRILYNTMENGAYCCHIYDGTTKKTKTIGMPVYSVSKDGKTALSLDFSRLHRLRPGYGYANLEDRTKNDAVPDGFAIWHIDLETGETKGLITYPQLYEFHHKKSMEGAQHKVNHIMLNPSADRFMFLHRWYEGSKKHSRLITCGIDGQDMFCLLDDGMVSHCNWKNDTELIAWARTKEKGNHYYLLDDQTLERRVFQGEALTCDGHPSYSEDGQYLITDTYPDLKGKQHLYLVHVPSGRGAEIAQFYSRLRYNNDTRCDLHPRFNRSGTKVCVDAASEHYRQVFELNITEWKKSLMAPK